MVILVTSKNDEDPIKIEGARVATIRNIDFSNTRGQLTPQSEVGSGRNSISSEILLLSLLPARKKKQNKKKKKNKNDPLKNKDAREATTQNIDFSNTQGQMTPQSEVRSGRNSNSSEIL